MVFLDDMLVRKPGLILNKSAGTSYLLEYSFYGGTSIACGGCRHAGLARNECHILTPSIPNTLYEVSTRC